MSQLEKESALEEDTITVFNDTLREIDSDRKKYRRTGLPDDGFERIADRFQKESEFLVKYLRMEEKEESITPDLENKFALAASQIFISRPEYDLEVAKMEEKLCQKNGNLDYLRVIKQYKSFLEELIYLARKEGHRDEVDDLRHEELTTEESEYYQVRAQFILMRNEASSKIDR